VTPIEKTHAGQSDVNLALLNLVKQYGECSYAMLFDQFGDMTLMPRLAHTKFGKKLAYMLYVEHLQCNDARLMCNRRYTLGPMAGKRPPGCNQWREYSPDAKVAPQDSYLPEHVDAQPASPASPANLARYYRGPVVPPRQFNTMTAPVYVPPPSPAMRPGSLDYQRHASYGHRC